MEGEGFRSAPRFLRMRAESLEQGRVEHHGGMGVRAGIKAWVSRRVSGRVYRGLGGLAGWQREGAKCRSKSDQPSGVRMGTIQKYIMSKVPL